MKRKREISIILDAFKSAGLTVNDTVEKAIASGLKQVREEKYHDRSKKNKEKTQ